MAPTATVPLKLAFGMIVWPIAQNFAQLFGAAQGLARAGGDLLSFILWLNRGEAMVIGQFDSATAIGREAERLSWHAKLDLVEARFPLFEKGLFRDFDPPCPPDPANLRQNRCFPLASKQQET